MLFKTGTRVIEAPKNIKHKHRYATMTQGHVHV